MSSVDVMQELRSARPIAPDALRLRVETLAAESTAATRPAARRSRSWLPQRRLLVAVPLAASLAVAAAAGVGLQDGLRSPRVEAIDYRDGTRTSALGEDSAPADAYGGASPEQTGALGDGTNQAKAAAGAPPATTGTVAPGPATDRAQRFYAQLTIQVEDTDALAEATKRAQDSVRALGGHIVTVSYASSTEGTASLTLRVPTGKVQDAIGQLTGLGTILSQQVQIDDLQAQLDVTGKRIETLVGQIAAITSRLKTDTLDSETRATLEARRSRLQTELRSLRQTSTSINAEARMATIQLQLVTDQESLVAPPVPSRFDRALDRTVDILAWEALAVLYLAVIAAPIAVALLALWFGRKAVRRRGDDHVLASN